MDLKEFGLHAQNLITIIVSIVNLIGGRDCMTIKKEQESSYSEQGID